MNDVVKLVEYRETQEPVGDATTRRALCRPNWRLRVTHEHTSHRAAEAGVNRHSLHSDGDRERFG